MTLDDYKKAIQDLALSQSPAPSKDKAQSIGLLLDSLIKQVEINTKREITPMPTPKAYVGFTYHDKAADLTEKIVFSREYLQDNSLMQLYKAITTSFGLAPLKGEKMVVQFDPVSRNHVKYTPIAIYAMFTEDSGEYEIPHFEDSWQQLLPNINHIVVKRRD